MRKRRLILIILVLGACLGGWAARRPIVQLYTDVILRIHGERTIADRTSEYGPAVKTRLSPVFNLISVAYPPQQMTLIGLKAERRLEVWVTGADGKWKHLNNYPILAMSGKLGPKLRQGDGQVPEGLYRIESLNPNSRYHLALRVGYPNADDEARSQEEGRTELGGDIMIHGNACSIGCLAMGNEAAEDLFILAAETGLDNIQVILSPVDFRVRDLPSNMPTVPKWTKGLYAAIRKELNQRR